MDDEKVEISKKDAMLAAAILREAADRLEYSKTPNVGLDKLFAPIGEKRTVKVLLTQIEKEEVASLYMLGVSIANISRKMNKPYSTI